MTEVDTFFDDAEVKRDGQDRPLILPAGAPQGSPRIAYTRASGLAEYISDSAHFHKWEMRYLAKAMGKHEDLAALAGAETYSTGFDEDRRTKSASGKRLDGIIERALDRERIHEKADYGSAFHLRTEPDNDGYTPDRMKPDVASFEEQMKRCGIVTLATEVFTANDTLQAAGTFDHLCYVPGYGVVVCDKKTGKIDYHHFGVQLSVYAYGQVYILENDQRIDLETLAGGDVNREVGLVFWTPAHSGRTRILEVDLVKGYDAAKAAAQARDYNEDRSIGADVTNQIAKSADKQRAKVLTDIKQSSTKDELTAHYHDHKHLWTDDLTDAAKAKIKELIA